MPTRVGYPSGFWGDDQRAPKRMLDRGDVDYLAMDYLAEVTMAILKRQQRSDPDLGYARDFPSLVGELAESLVAEDVAVVANAGGVNPTACMEQTLEAVEDTELTVAAVTGDDITARVDELHDRGISLDNIDTDESYEQIADDLIAANAYLGAFPIADALDRGADVVVTGRCVDAALVLGPLIHEHGWSRDELDQLASGVVAGHLLECGTQVTGGVFTDWRGVEFEEIGYPIAEVAADGDFTVTKTPGTGGTVSAATVKEQLTYEIKDPARYATPDVVADFLTPEIKEIGEDAVRVSGCRGRSRPEALKVTALYEDGYKAQLLITYAWPDALAKARKAAEIISTRTEDVNLQERRTDFVGYDACQDGVGPEPEDPNEILLRIAVKAADESTIRAFGNRALPVMISGPPHVTPLVQGRPKATDVLSFWPMLIPREEVTPTVETATTGGEA